MPDIMSENSDNPEMPEVFLRRGQNKGSYLYRQFAHSIEQLIADGHFKPGDKLPSMDQLAEQFNLNKLTVYKAIQYLARKNIVCSKRARGTFICDPDADSGESGMAAVLNVGIVSRVMYPGGTGFYHLMLTDAMRCKLDSYGVGMLMLPTNNLASESQIVDIALKSDVCGVICVGELSSNSLKKLVQQVKVPFVLLDFREIGLTADTVCQNNRNGAFLAVEHLIKTGRRHIAIVTGADDQRVTSERLEGALHAIEQYGIESPACIEKGNYGKLSGSLAMERLLKSGVEFDSIFFMNDEMAMGGMEVARGMGKHIPRDFAVIGYDDIPLAGQDVVNLSTVSAPVVQMGELAVEHLMGMREKPHKITQTLELMPTLVVRGTTATE